jgi:hypothetical protein
MENKGSTDVSVGINTLIVYVPDQSHLKLKANESFLFYGFGRGMTSKNFMIN